jgi:hypothetical protein
MRFVFGSKNLWLYRFEYLIFALGVWLLYYINITYYGYFDGFPTATVLVCFSIGMKIGFDTISTTFIIDIQHQTCEFIRYITIFPRYINARFSDIESFNVKINENWETGDTYILKMHLKKRTYKVLNRKDNMIMQLEEMLNELISNKNSNIIIQLTDLIKGYTSPQKAKWENLKRIFGGMVSLGVFLLISFVSIIYPYPS